MAAVISSLKKEELARPALNEAVKLPSVPRIKFLGMLLMSGPRSTVVVTCHFDVPANAEMRGELIGHWSRAVSCLLIRTARVHIK